MLAEQVTTFLARKPGGRYFDGTLGAGGHAAALLERLGADARLIGVDQDPAAIAYCRQRFSGEPRITLQEGNFGDVAAILAGHGWTACDGMLLDLGFSSMQLDTPERGFSYLRDGPLDMQMSPHSERSAADLINDEPVAQLAHILRTYGEEPLGRRIAAAIERERNVRPLQTTADLARVVEGATPPGPTRTKTLSRVFQAFRIVVNEELRRLQDFLDVAIKMLAPGGRVAVISYHSLEDRMVKTAFTYYRKSCVCPPELPQCVCGKVSELRILTGKPVRPTAEEIQQNRRARSARLRVGEKLETS